MTKFYPFAAMALLIGSAANAQTIFQEDFPSEESFGKWVVVDANEDDTTWKFDETGEPTHVFYSYSSSNPANDWLISPAISVPEAGTYLLKFKTKGSSYTEHLDVYVGNAATVEGMTEKVFGSDLALVDYTKTALLTLEPGDVFLGFHCTSGADKWRLYVGDISLEKIDNPMDMGILSVLSPITGENLGEEDVTVKLVNAGPNPVSSFKMSYEMTSGDEVKASAEEEVNLATPLAPGEEMTFTFAKKADLSTPRTAYNFTINVTVEGDVNPDNDSAKTEVRHVAAATVPYYMGFESTDDTSNISFINNNNDEGDWGINVDSWFFSMARTGQGSLCYNYDSNNAADDWAFLDPFQLEAGYYCLKFWYSATENHPERLRVVWGTSANPADMTNVIVELNPMTNPKYAESVNIFQIPADGKYFIGFYAFSDANENWICLDDVSLEWVDPNASDLEILSVDKPFSYWRAPNSVDAEVTLRNVGVKDVTADLVASIDGSEAKRQSVDFTAMKTQTVTVPGLMEGLADGAHTVRFEIAYDDDTKAENNAIETEVVVLPAQAVYFQDFEKVENTGTDTDPHYALPTELTYRSEDSYTIDPNAGDEFEEHGFGIFKLGHPVLGNFALAGCTWFTETGSADRWVVLPQMEVTGENAWFAWDAMSFNPSYPERYTVRVSDGDDYWSAYNTEAEVDEETIYHKTRGINLGKYAGKEVYIAFRITTYGGEALVMDNFGVYGDVKRIGESAIGNLAVEGASEAPVQYFTLQGVEVPASNLTPGIYIRRQGNESTKIVVK